MIKSFFVLLTLMCALLVYANTTKKAAQVIMLKGEASKIENGVSVVLKDKDWVNVGDTITTQSRSVARLKFIDNSVLNIGPKSEIVVSKFSKDESGVIDVISGKIRAQVTKDYLDMNKDNSKMYVKSRAAVMGVRGTDFMFSANPETNASTVVLFEGKVQFNNLTGNENLNNLENIVRAGNMVDPGQFSVASVEMPKPTVPAKMNSEQFKGLMHNGQFKEAGIDAGTDKKGISANLAPPGIKAEATISKDLGVKETLVSAGVAANNVAETKVEALGSSANVEDSKGYVRGTDVKPADGSIVHVDSGTVIPMGSDSQFDANKKEWVSTSVGTTDVTGKYIPPQGYMMTDNGKLLRSENGQLREVVIEIKPVGAIESLNSLNSIKVEKGAEMIGPAPASLDTVAPSANNTQTLGEPPRPIGETYQPPSFNTINPTMQTAPIAPIPQYNATPVEINPIKR